VDTHIFRVANRLKLAPGKNVREVEDKLVKVVPKEFAHDAHHWLILHGRYVCKARKPDCEHCIVVDLCAFKDKVLPVTTPRTNRRTIKTARKAK
jgi:endonuclease-3